MQLCLPTSAYAENVELTSFLQSPSTIDTQCQYIRGIVVGAMVLRQQHHDSYGMSTQTLILRRIATDTYPLDWELPGGGADFDADRTLADVAARELWEETGLRAKRMVCPIRPDGPGEQQEQEQEMMNINGDKSHHSTVSIFSDEEGDDWGIANFIVEVEDLSRPVLIDPREHVEWAWVTEQEVRDSALSGVGAKREKELKFVSEVMRRTILEGFRIMA
ncbi:hypothetical protein K431DRAFT_287162 [Polychaeton citri CBS 116435]|uniref:Nudix hydrolase domain-containing protein n=1 Tax=Polychaeton citri CBS 116435 TaxID=1314669 RepID=A0A9P4Q3T5_9PEZI|nr:hypothetical protein K431DRAFT_287162 [Polychaeton citri CBS 116435]